MIFFLNDIFIPPGINVFSIVLIEIRVFFGKPNKIDNGNEIVCEK